jgi:hypothetical protein
MMGQAMAGGKNKKKRKGGQLTKRLQAIKEEKMSFWTGG